MKSKSERKENTQGFVCGFVHQDQVNPLATSSGLVAGLHSRVLPNNPGGTRAGDSPSGSTSSTSICGFGGAADYTGVHQVKVCPSASDSSASASGNPREKKLPRRINMDLPMPIHLDDIFASES